MAEITNAKTLMAIFAQYYCAVGFNDWWTEGRKITFILYFAITVKKRIQYATFYLSQWYCYTVAAAEKVCV